MASRRTEDAPSPSPSATVLPVNLTKSRRGSLASISSRSVVDKEALSQALDQVHSNASRTEALTSFNDFAPPPSSASPSDDKSLAGQLASGSFGGIYSRLRASVGAPKDLAAPVSRPRSRGSGKSQAPDSHRPLTPSGLSKGSPGPALTTSSRDSLPQVQEPPPSRLESESASRPEMTHFPSKTSSSLPFAENAKLISNKDIPERDLRHAPQLRSAGTGNGEEMIEPLGAVTTNTDPDPALDSSTHVRSSDTRALGNGIDTPTRENDSRSTSAPKPSQANKDARTKTTSSGPNLDDRIHRAQSQLPGLRLSQTGSSEESRPSLASGPPLAFSLSDTLESQSDGQHQKRDSRQPSTAIVDQVKRKVLSRDFWMKDENAKVCFNCGETFTTFKRKHHCRLCGQIYCATCTNLISGKPFGQASKLRVCKTCEVMINGDDSSDPDDDDVEDFKQTRFSELPHEIGIHQNGDYLSLHRQSGDGLRSSASSLRQPPLTRPSSSRSLKSLTGRPRSSSQRPRRSRHQHMRSLGILEGGAPFYKGASTQATGELSLPAFHNDAIIDPDLAPFMSDEGSSDDEQQQPNIAATMGSDLQDRTSTSPDEATVLMRRGRPKSSSKSAIDMSTSRGDVEGSNLLSFRVDQLRRQGPTRTWSSGSLARHVSSPRIARSENLFTEYSHQDRSSWASRHSSDSPAPFDQKLGSLSHFSAASNIPSAELNQASLEYVKKLMRQFLTDCKIKNATKWEKLLIPIYLRCAEEVDPNIQRGDNIDIRHYVKLKRAPGGRLRDSAYLPGVVFTNKPALKSMPRHINNPRILLVSFPLIYGKKESTLMSIDPVMAQESEYLRNLVNRIMALKPTVLLAQREVSGLALQFLHEARITVVKMVKPSVMHAVGRCAETSIVASVDKLNMDPKNLGTCQTFAVKTYAYGGIKKTCIILNGCEPDLGCTVILRGSDPRTLKQIKGISDFMVYVVYNLKLETCLLRDEFVSIPSDPVEITSEKGPTFAAFTETSAHTGETIMNNNTTGLTRALETNETVELQDSNKKTQSNGNVTNPSESVPATYNKMVQDLERRALSVSPFVKLADPFLLLRGREQEKQMNHLLQLQRQDNLQKLKEYPDTTNQKFELIKPEMIYGDDDHASPQIREALRAIHSAEYDKLFHRYTLLRRRWESYIAGVVNPFSPLTHQRIVVLFSIISTPTASSCEGPDLLGLDFYQEHSLDRTIEPDVPLGEYIERLCDQVDASCTAQTCEKKMIDHHRQYVHGEGQISIFCEKMKSRIRGLDNTILMWSCCRICDHETQVVPMSSNSWKYSFGKYLELCFWSDPMHPRAGACPHDIHRDHVRYFGFRNLAVRVQYDPINILEVSVPRMRIMWKPEKDLVLKNSEYQNMEDRIGRFFSSVKMRIKSVKLSNIIPDKQEACKADMDSLSKRANMDYDFVVKKLQDKYMASKYYEIVPLNRAIRALQEKVGDWDNIFIDFEKKYLPSEKEIRKLAQLQLKPYLDHNESMSTIELGEENLDEKKLEHGQQITDEKISQITPSPTTPKNASRSQSPRVAVKEMSPLPVISPLALEHEKRTVQNLDLAFPGDSPGTVLSTDAVTGPQVRHSLASYNVQGDLNAASLEAVEPQPLHPKVAEKAETIATSANITSSQQGGKTTVPSAIPKLTHSQTLPASPPPLIRSKTQPIGAELPSNLSTSQEEPDAAMTQSSSSKGQNTPVQPAALGSPQLFNSVDKKTADKIGATSSSTKNAFQSMIPRAVLSKRQHSKVSSLAKHFEQLSREFEKERLRERRQRAATDHQRRRYPVASSRPMVEVFEDAREAVKEQETHEDATPSEAPEEQKHDSINSNPQAPQNKPEDVDQTQGGDDESFRGSTEEVGQDDSIHGESYPTSVVEDTPPEFEIVPDDPQGMEQADESRPRSPDTLSDLNVELPKHEKTSLMKIITSFWFERSTFGWSPLEYPLLSTNHIFADSDVIVREDEPSSVIAWALSSQDYQAKRVKFRERARESVGESHENSSLDEDEEVERILLGSTATHLTYTFQLGATRLLCKVLYAESFDAIRNKSGVLDRFVESLSRCIKWDSKGGKTKSLFLKTLDERFVLKSLSKIETESFVKFAPDYFDYMAKCLFHGLPSAMAKMVGFYQIVIKNPTTGIDFNYFVQVMENVFYEGPSNRMFDLKGSMRNRRIESTGEKNEVLLDENLLDYISSSPVYVRNHSNSLLAASISNDTLFCSKQNVMDYSLIVGLYDDNKELIVGIIDYIRTYTWDKKLESWIKDRGKYKPTVRSPKDYRNRFRASIPRYFPLAPSCWQVFGQQRLEHGKPVWGAVVDPQDLDDPADEAGEAVELDEEPEALANAIIQ